MPRPDVACRTDAWMVRYPCLHPDARFVIRDAPAPWFGDALSAKIMQIHEVAAIDLNGTALKLTL